ncbi:MAG: GH92 family glycosyl hydrolase [Paludibacteraceae bacterium]|nr:GH92 family glycosyl hydrolase [Paludibacteraceae bacterium]
MKRIVPFILTFVLLSFGQCLGQNLTQYVNPLVGTDAHGHTFPGAIVPFGQIQPSPDTRLGGWDGCSGYHFSDDTIYGFSHTHLNGTGCEDYCDILLMPVILDGAKSCTPQYYKSHFSHDNEVASPGYYSVLLDRYDIKVELTASQRVAVHRYTFNNNNGTKAFIVDLNHRDRLINAGFAHKSGKIISGFRESSSWNPHQYCYFALKTSVPFSHIVYMDNDTRAIVFLPDNTKSVEVYLSISGVDNDGAVRNLATCDNQKFNSIRKNADATWNKTLSKIELEGGTLTQLRNFYTALYHCYTSPYLWSDEDGRYRGTDNQIHQASNGRNVYTVFSLWDTFRTLHPLMSIIEPDLTHDFLYTMQMQWEQGHELTMWELASHETHCMIGYHSAPVILDAYLNSEPCRDDVAMMFSLLQGLIATSNRTPAHCTYANRNYLSSEDDNESVSKTIEYAYDDWCIAKLAGYLYPELFSLSDKYYKRCQSWQNVMDLDGFMRARRNGAFVTPFNPVEVNNHYTEANCWQYSSFVPHDVYRWAEMLGGNDKALAFLDSLFTMSSQTSGREQVDITGCIGQYAHGNEPSHHAAYLYTYFGKPAKTNSLVHRILDELYTPQPDGLCGNEDCGQMSAWYVMSSMGLYPVCPGSGEYVTLQPIFSKVTIHRPSGDMVIDETWQAGKFFRDGSFHDTSVTGIPSEYRTTPCPVFSDWQPQFSDSAVVAITCKDPYAIIYYTLDGSAPTEDKAIRYTKPFTVKQSVIINAMAKSPDLKASETVAHSMALFVPDKALTYVTRPEPQYTENGEKGLIDNIHAPANYRIGGWQGWTQDMEVIVDLLSIRQVNHVGVECLENINSWIVFPSAVEVYTSSDGVNYTYAGKAVNSSFPVVYERNDEFTINEFGINLNTIARYVKLKAVNYGLLPDWHLSAGNQAWLFADEVIIR